MTRQATFDYDAVVIGAGPAGSATAARLAAQGFRVALLERARFPRPKPCAEYLSPGTVAALGRLGVLPEILAERPARLAGMRVIAPDGSWFEGRFLQGTGLALPRERLDEHLARAAQRAGAELIEGASFQAFALQPAGAVTVRARQSSGPFELVARVLIGADGLNSRVASQLGLARRTGPRRAALVAHARGVADLDEVGEMHVAQRGYIGVAPLGAGLANLAMVVDLAQAKLEQPLEATFRAWLAAFPALRPRLAELELVSPVRAIGPFGRSTCRATADRVLLVGDAADFYDPFTGEGLFAALRGAELAARRAAEALDRDRLEAGALRAYDHDRRAAFRGKWTLERIVSWVIARPRLLGQLAGQLARRPELADQLVSVTAQVAPASGLFRPAYLLRLVS